MSLKKLDRKTAWDPRVNPSRWILILSFGIPFLIMLVLFILNDIYPFGGRSFLYSDMYHQYMPFFSEFMEKIKAGEGLSYSYNVGIGSNFLALYVYYLASPLHWLAFLVPQAHLMEFMSYLVVVKIGLCGLTFCIYLRRHFRAGRDASVLFFSCFYALSGYMAAYNWNIMWLDCVVLLPLILLGLEKLVKEGKCTLYCVTLALSILTNFYISIMICIFLVLYFLVLLFLEKRFWRAVRDFALYSLLAGAIAAVLLVPEVCAILETDFGDMDFPKTVKSYFSVLDMLARHCMCIDAERALAHWPNIYSGVATFLLVPMFALNRGISAKRRFAYLALTGVMLVSFSTNILDFIWHGLNYPDSLPARQSFIYIMLVLVMGYDACRNLMKEDGRRIIHCYIGAVVFLLFVEKFVDAEHFKMGVEYLNIGFITVYAVLLYLYRTRDDKVVRTVVAAAVMAVVIAESGINTYNTSLGTVNRSQYLDELKDYQALYETARNDALEVSDTDGAEEKTLPFFRMEKFSRKTKNDGTLAGYPTASVFSSTLNSYVMDMYKRLGMRHSKVYYGFDGATLLTSAMLNVNYMYGKDAREEGPLFEHLADSGEISLYRSLCTLPFGYVAPTEYDIPTGYDSNGFALQNAMVKKLGIKGNLFNKVSSDKTGNNVRFTANEDGYYYGIVTASGTKKIEQTVGEETRNFSDLKKGCILHLGYFEADTAALLKNGVEDDETPKIQVDIYKMDESILRETLAMLSEDSLTNVTYDSTHINGEIELSKAGRLILSVPYEKGWTVVVDGEKTEPSLFGGTLMALDLEEGSHEISMHYVPYGRNAGLIISVIGIAAFTAITVIGRIRSKKKVS